MPKNNSKPERERRRRQAEERQARFDSLTLEEQYDSIFARPGMASRELTRFERKNRVKS